MERKDEGNTDEFQKLVDEKAKYMVADLGGIDSFKSKSFITFKKKQVVLRFLLAIYLV